MKGIFSVDSKFYTACSKVVDMLLLSIYWVIGCLPVITFAASTASMYHVAVKCVRRQRGRVTREFWEAYKKNLSQGVILSIIFGAIGFFITLYFRNLFSMPLGTNETLFYAVCLGVLGLFYSINLVWIMPLLSRLVMPLPKLMQLTLGISLRYMLRSLAMVMLLAAGAVLVGIFWPLLALIPGAVAFCISYLVEPVMLRYMPKQEKADDDWRYEK